MAVHEIEGLYDQLRDALTQRVASLGEGATERDFSNLLTQIRAMRLVAEQLSYDPEPSREASLVAAMRQLTSELRK